MTVTLRVGEAQLTEKKLTSTSSVINGREQRDLTVVTMAVEQKLVRKRGKETMT